MPGAAGCPASVSDDLRHGSDAEFGQSIYEPFGIAQIEPIGFGSLSVVSDVCGCLGFLRASIGEGGAGSRYIRADYTRLDRQPDLPAAPQIGAGARRRAEEARKRRGCPAARRSAAGGGRPARGKPAEGVRDRLEDKLGQVAGEYFLPVLRQLER